MTQLNITDLFTPTPSGIGPGGSTSSPAAGSWMAQNLENAATVGLEATAFQSGSPSRSWLAVSAIDQAKEDCAISGLSQGGFLDYAASGTVTYTDPNGVTTVTPVSPDPSDPSSGNTNGATTWLDLLASSVYSVRRIPGGPAVVTISIANTSGTTPPAYPVGTYHVQDETNTSSTYANDAALTIAPSSVLGGSITAIGSSGTVLVTTSSAHGLATNAVVYIAGAPSGSGANGFWAVTVTGTRTFLLNGSTAGSGGSGGSVYSTIQVPFTADAPGPSFSAAAGDIATAVTANSGVVVSSLQACTGIPYESNVSLAARCRLKLQSLSPNGANGAYVFFALTAYAILQGTATGFPVPATPVTLQGGPVTRALAVATPRTGDLTVYVAQAPPAAPTQGAPVVLGVPNLPVQGATNATPIVLQANGHGLASGAGIIVSGVLGNTGANGTWSVTVVDANHLTLVGSAGTAAYTGGGQVEGGDLGLVDSVIQQYCVPDGDTGGAASALTQLVAIAANVTVPAAQRASYLLAVNAALTAYVNGLPIGGLPLTGGGSGIPIDIVIGILYSAGSVVGATSYVTSVSNVTINGVAIDLVYPSNVYDGVLYPAPNLTVSGS